MDRKVIPTIIDEGKLITDKVKQQILDIRDSGKSNMFDVKRVQYLAYHKGYYELVTFLEEHEKEYAQFIMSGKES